VKTSTASSATARPSSTHPSSDRLGPDADGGDACVRAHRRVTCAFRERAGQFEDGVGRFEIAQRAERLPAVGQRQRASRIVLRQLVEARPSRRAAADWSPRCSARPPAASSHSATSACRPVEPRVRRVEFPTLVEGPVEVVRGEQVDQRPAGRGHQPPRVPFVQVRADAARERLVDGVADELVTEVERLPRGAQQVPRPEGVEPDLELGTFRLPA
jgi:hypothetical protein